MNASKPKVYLGLPCYNEALNIGPLLEKIFVLNEISNFEVVPVVIDDASKDNTQEVLKPYLERIELITHPENRGLTGGINSAFEYFFNDLEKNDSALAYGLMDGDNSHNPHTIPSMLTKILEEFDVVIASRFRPGARIEGVSWFRQMLSLGLTFLFKALRNVPGVRDYSCGYRLYSPRIVKKLKENYTEGVVKEQSFASMVEILLKCHLLGASFFEVPFYLRYDLKLGESKMPFLSTILGDLKLLSFLRDR